MSFDRVLPKPAALHYDSPQVTLSRPTSNLLEHKIMNDNVSKVSILDRHMDGVPVGSSCRYAADGLPQVHLSSLNRAKIALNKIASNAPIEPPKPAAPLPAKSIPFRERSSTSQWYAYIPPLSQYLSRDMTPRTNNLVPAFILYRQHYQAAVVAQNPGLANPDISKIIGEQWRRLPQETKDEWKALAEQYPEYRYQPRRYGRDGNPRGSSSGISHNPPGSTVCSRCGGRVMNPPVSPETPFNPNGSSNGTGASLQHEAITGRSYPCRSKDSDRPSNPIKMGSNGESLPPRQRQWEETVNGSPDSKRRRISTQLPSKPNIHRDRSPDGSYPISPYTARPEAPSSRGSFHMLQPPRPYRSVQEYPQPDPSLKLPPLQTTAPVSSSATPATQYVQESSSLEATVMTIPFLNKIKVLAKISPPLLPSFRDGASRRRGAVVSVDGQEPIAVKSVVDFLNNTLEKEGKYHTHIFEGPDIRLREGYSESGQMGDATVDYLNTISAWHRISDEIVSFVKSLYGSLEPKSVDEDNSTPGASPKGSIPKGAEIHISSPAQSSENGSVSYSSSSGSAPCPVPVALVPRYQLTTADAFACSVPIGDSYAPLDHWQWMASLWRACVGPDITVYVRECEKDELDRYGGNPVEVRLHDARTIVVRRAAGSPRELEEKTLKRVGFEIEDYLTQ
ncbi:unnamed protein product [Aspergillus oryzae]|uniref:Unnamed protein product n=2 Tax=Aspergillus oryzae TaxID=5062 RepID=A0AAN4Y8T4_ASPOZ|nr:unnamed protein product [Aspergillus oryzae]GMF89811.1 unnamed protein product [Aspergillus oryzae]GMG08053.1 unnamed protein product [Aspergillus oryzae]GMG24180.1 unnamed protein product [Aspergillus oryzae]GMG52558.1 unnamed protein product [Aspergillus oryzae var. brunneus]